MVFPLVLSTSTTCEPAGRFSYCAEIEYPEIDTKLMIGEAMREPPSQDCQGQTQSTSANGTESSRFHDRGHRDNVEFVQAFQRKPGGNRLSTRFNGGPLSHHDAACCIKSSSSFQISISPEILLTV